MFKLHLLIAMRVLFFLLLIGVCTLDLSAQKKLLPGYVITLNHDTISGYVDYRNWDKSPKEVAFAPGIDEDLITYNVGEIFGFGVNDEIYVGAMVDTEFSDSKNLEASPKFNIREEAAFLLALVRGEKSLFYTKNEAGKENFYIQEDSQFVLLKHKRYLVDQERGASKTGVAENNRYLGQLLVYLDDCDGIRGRIARTEYHLAGLQELFTYYYSCVERSPTFLQKKDDLLNAGLVSGVSFHRLYFNGSDFIYLSDVPFDRSKSYAGGIFLEIFMPMTAKKWSIYNELLYTSYSTSGQMKSSGAVVTSFFDYSYLNLNNMLRFSYPIGNFKPFVNLGVSNGLVVKGTNKRNRFYLSSPDVGPTEEPKPLDEIRSYELAVIAGFGLGFKSFSIECRYEQGNGMSEYSYLQSITKAFHVLLGYSFP